MKLPDIIKLEDYNGSWEDYIEAVYGIFKRDFIDNRPSYNGLNVGFIKLPLFQGKESCFWHLTSQGKIEEKRTPDFGKCERIEWIKLIIEASGDKGIKFWLNRRKKGSSSAYEERICLCYGDWEYLVVLVKRKTYFLLWTAYPIEHQHTKTKLEKEYNVYKKANTAS